MSSFVRFTNISFSYNNMLESLLRDCSVDLQPGWTSLCGANGAGKTTFIKLILGHIKPNTGMLDVKGHVGYVCQVSEVEPVNLADFICDYSKTAIKLREQLGIKDEWMSRFISLSVGEKKRLELACALWSNPTILLVDEPSNHVDSRTRKIILSVLLEFKGIGLLISHDRVLLNNLCTKTLFIESGKLSKFNAPYATAQKEHEQNSDLLLKTREKLQLLSKKFQKAAHDQSELVAKRAKSLSKQKLAKHDHDAKERINRAKLFGADNADTRKVKVLGQKASKISDEVAQIKIQKSYNMGVYFSKIITSRKVHIEQAKVYLEHLALKYPSLSLISGDKLAIIGNNGAGKTTFINHIYSLLKHPGVIYAKQESSKDEREALTDRINNLPSDEKGQLLTLVRRFGSSPKSLVSGSPPSPGIWQKLAIAQAIINQAPIMLLDEPTNHMDLPSIKVLQEALGHYGGILIFVSHDEEFVRALATKILNITKQAKQSIIIE